MKIDSRMKAIALDIAERVVWSFLEAFIGALLLSPVINLSALKAAAIGGLVAALTYVKATVATLKAGTLSPASTVAAPAPPAIPVGMSQTGAP
jgi:hypothetical protein